MMNDVALADARARFSAARCTVFGESTEQGGIGRISEKCVHKIIKLYIDPNEEHHEVKYMGYVADIVNRQGIYEIQTRAAERLVPKLSAFLSLSSVCVVLPVIAECNIRWIDKASGEISDPRKSPKHETVYHAFRELYKIRRFLSEPNLSVKILVLHAEEFKYLDGGGKNRKNGATRLERIPTKLIDEIDIRSREDFVALLPRGLAKEFTAKDICKSAAFLPNLSSSVAGVFASAGAIRFLRKEGRAFVYEICD